MIEVDSLKTYVVWSTTYAEGAIITTGEELYDAVEDILAEHPLKDIRVAEVGNEIEVNIGFTVKNKEND